jgi:hypothetical protein
MRRALILIAVVACCGCQRGTTRVSDERNAAGPATLLVNRVWARSDSLTGLPGVMRVFLSDSTLIMDSCWETYQLATWRLESDSVVSWQEGSAQVRAKVLELTRETLALRVDVADGSQEEHYRVATVPYLCPDMRR